jgi:hypothetical protein
MLDEFAIRAALYADWDRRLGHRTRFFAAAALINAALVELCSLPLMARATCAAGISFLAYVGANLQTLNIALAERIELERWRGEDSDVVLVTLEQLTVEKLLGQFAHRDQRAHGRAIRQLDRLLYCLGRAGRAGSSSCGPSIELLSRGVRVARADAGRYVSFSSMRDRIAIGEALICLLRRADCRELRGAFPAGKVAGDSHFRG